MAALCEDVSAVLVGYLLDAVVGDLFVAVE